MILNKNIYYTSIDDNIVITNLDSGEIFSISNLSAYIWKKIFNDNETIPNIKKELYNNYSTIDKKKIDENFANFIKSMQAKNLVTLEANDEFTV